MTTATDWEGLLQAGIAAYKGGEYEQAIATLKRLSRCPSSTVRTKAGMGLVRTFMAQRDWKRAEALCKTLRKSAKPPVQQWATDTLEKIKTRGRQQTAHTSGFVSLAPAQPKSPKQPNSRQPKPPTQPRITVSMFHYAYLNGELDEAGRPIEREQASASFDRPPGESPGESGREFKRKNGYVWRHAGRLSKGRSLGRIKQQPIWIAQTFSAAALYTLVLFVCHRVLIQYNSAVRLSSRLLPDGVTQRLPFDTLPANYNDLVWIVLCALIIIAIASPWLWDLALRFTTDRQPFSNQKLRQHSTEAARLIAQRCRKRRWPMPTLWKLKTDVPLLFSYGWLPRNARIVVSDGLLSTLSAEELATVIAYETSHWRTVYWPLLSLQGLLLLVLHQMYWQIALWGNRRTGPLRWTAGIVSNASYCIFWMTRLPGLWISRVRTYYGDRTSVQLTGDPNALARALGKIAFALADSTEQVGYTPPAIERFSILLPVSIELSRSGLYGTVPLCDLFAWDNQHPLRHWMSLLDAHPPLGDRLRLLMAYAKHWKLEPEIAFAIAPPSRKKGLSRSEWTTLMQQGTPFFGLLFGAVIGLTCLLIGATGRWLEWPAVDWMHEDPGIFWFCPLMGIGLGTFLRINRFFPDLSLQMPPSSDIAARLCSAALLPADSVATKLSGTVIGRPGLANWLGQDLMIKTSDGLLKLHVFSTWERALGPINPLFWLALGPFGNLISRCDRPSHLTGKSVQILGWFRRGNRIWLDVDKVRLSSGQLIEGTHPTTSLMIAVGTSVLALWLLGFGQIFQAIGDKVG